MLRIVQREAAGLAATLLLTAACTAPGAVPAIPATATPASVAPAAQAAAAAVDLAQFTPALAPVAEGLQAPLFVTHAGDGSGRLFVVEKAGRIRIVQEGELAATPFLDLTDRVCVFR